MKSSEKCIVGCVIARVTLTVTKPDVAFRLYIRNYSDFKRDFLPVPIAVPTYSPSSTPILKESSDL